MERSYTGAAAAQSARELHSAGHRSPCEWIGPGADAKTVQATPASEVEVEVDAADAVLAQARLETALALHPFEIARA